MDHVHRRLTDEQVKIILKGYSKGTLDTHLGRFLVT